jgi:hypothetical protein
MAMWAVHLLGRTWRGWLRLQHGVAIRETARRLDGDVRASWLGWRVVAEAGTVEWRGSMRGEATVIRAGASKHLTPGLLGPDEVAQAISRQTRG